MDNLYFYAIYNKFDNLIEVFDSIEEVIYFLYKIKPDNNLYKTKYWAVKKRIKQNKKRKIIPNKFKIYKFKL